MDKQEELHRAGSVIISFAREGWGTGPLGILCSVRIPANAAQNRGHTSGPIIAAQAKALARVVFVVRLPHTAIIHAISAGEASAIWRRVATLASQAE